MQKTALWDASSEAKFVLLMAGLNYHNLDRACVKVEKRGTSNLFVQLLKTFVLSASSITLLRVGIYSTSVETPPQRHGLQS